MLQSSLLYLGNCARWGHSYYGYYGRLIETQMHSIEWWHC